LLNAGHCSPCIDHRVQQVPTGSYKEKKINAGSGKYSPHLFRERSYFGSGYRKSPSLKKRERINEDQFAIYLHMIKIIRHEDNTFS